jgi:LVIVD repeat
MQGRVIRCLLLFVLASGLLAAPATADHDGDPDIAGISKLFNQPNGSGAVNSDIAFWGDRAYQGHYDGVQIFDISDPAAPTLLNNFQCHGPQNDPVVWHNLLFLAVDRTQTGPECGSVDTTHPDGTRFDEDPNGWEGVRILDVSDPGNPQFIKGVYTDCGAHTISLYPKNRGQILLYVSSYPLRPGPTCGPVTGPPAGNSPLHEKISVIKVPVHNPGAAKVIAQPRISYPGDPDNRFLPIAEHGLEGENLVDGLTACHDIGVFVKLRLAAAACAEQAQLWRIKRNGIPDTEHPLWVYDDNVDTDGAGGGDVVVDFWHSATFSWDGKVVNFIDESFGDGCPTVTPNVYGRGPGDTGAMFFLSTKSGKKLSQFTYPRAGEEGYCSAHLGNVVRTKDRDLLVNAWYEGGVDVIDFTDPFHPTETAYWDDTSDNWSAYWYEGPGLGEGQFPVYGTDGVEDPPTGEGFQVFSVLSDVTTEPLAYLNPQTQERTLGGHGVKVAAKKAGRYRSVSPAKAKADARAGSSQEVVRHLAP